MVTVDIEDIPNEIFEILERRAAVEGLSLEEYALKLMCEYAAETTIGDLRNRFK